MQPSIRCAVKSFVFSCKLVETLNVLFHYLKDWIRLYVRQPYLKMIVNTGCRCVWPAQTDFLPSFDAKINSVGLLRFRSIALFIYACRIRSYRVSGLDNRGKAVLVSNWSCLISWSTWKFVSVTIPLKLWCWGRSFIQIPPMLRITLRKPTRFLVERG